MFGGIVVLMLLISLSHHIGSLAIIISLEGAGGCPVRAHRGQLQGRQEEEEKERNIGEESVG